MLLFSASGSAGVLGASQVCWGRLPRRAGRLRRPPGGSGCPAAMSAVRARIVVSMSSSCARSPGVRADRMLFSTARMRGSIWSAVARPSGVISISTLRRSAGLGMRRIQPRCSSRSRVAVMVAEATRTRSLTCEGVSGSPAPSMTASAVAAGCGRPAVTQMLRSISPSSAWPVRTSVAQASVQLASAPGYSPAKPASTLTTPSEAGEGRLRLLPGLGTRLGSDIREDLDLRGALHSGPAHRLPQGRVVGEAARLLGAGEVMGDEQFVAVIGQPHHPLRDAAVLGPQWLYLVIDLAPGGVVADMVADRKCGAHVVPLPGAGLPAPCE